MKSCFKAAADGVGGAVSAPSMLPGRRAVVVAGLLLANPSLAQRATMASQAAGVREEPRSDEAARAPVPTFHVGSHQHGWPDNTDRFAAGTFARSRNTMEPFDYGAIRSHNVEALNAGSHNRWWTGREAGLNRYDWAILDRWVDKVTSRGHPILLNLFGVPEFAARLRDYRDVYGVVGGTSGPREPVAWQEFVRDTTARIIERKSAASLIAVEAWNEPIGDDVGGNGKFLVSRSYVPAHPDPQATLLAEITKHTFLGVRSVRAADGIPVLAGAQAYLDNKNLDRLLAAMTTRGESMLRFCDALSFHPYGVFDGNGIQPSLTGLTESIRRKLGRLGAAHLPLWASEVGLNAPWHDGVAKWWRRLSVTQRANAIYEWIARYKSLGWRAVLTYSTESTDDFLGLPQRHPAVAEALSRAYRDLQSG